MSISSRRQPRVVSILVSSMSTSSCPSHAGQLLSLFLFFFIRPSSSNLFPVYDDHTIAQWLEHRWLQARVPGSSPGGDSQFFLQTFPVCLFPSNQFKGNYTQNFMVRRVLDAESNGEGPTT